MKYFPVLLVTLVLFFQPDCASAQITASKIFLLKESENNQWCSYTAEATWKSKVQEVGAMTVGSLIYSNGQLSQINVTETDETGDWIVYDRYFLDGDAKLLTLSRLLNVLPGDRSVSETYSISDGKAAKTAASEKELSTGKAVTLPAGDWIPDINIATDTMTFPFSGLLKLPNLRVSSKSCVKLPTKQ